MKFLTTLIVAAGLAVAGCDADDSSRDLAFADAGARPDSEGDDPSVVGDGDDDDGVDEPDPVWSAFPPQAGDGSRLYGVLHCGLLDGPHYKVFEKNGDSWDELEEGTGNGPIREARPCMSREADEVRGKFLVWDDAPSIYMSAAGMDHELLPTTVENRWFGEVTPMSPPSEDGGPLVPRRQHLRGHGGRPRRLRVPDRPAIRGS